jgi:membrane protease YdiL (CAAX protease family)
MADRLRSVVLVAAVVIGLPAAVPHLAVNPGSATRVELGAQASARHGLGSCVPGALRCDPGAPASAAGPAWVGATFVPAGVLLVVAVRRTRRRRSTPSLARGVTLGIDRPPRLLALPF